MKDVPQTVEVVVQRTLSPLFVKPGWSNNRVERELREGHHEDEVPRDSARHPRHGEGADGRPDT
jgi:hypothetical protein